MHSQINVNTLQSFSALEDSLFDHTTSFKDRLDVISTLPVTNETEVRFAKSETDRLISDMQAFSNSLTEGLSRDNIPGHLRSHVVFEKGNGAAAA